MKTKAFFLIIFLAGSIPYIATAQTDQYIEISVSDTLRLLPKKIQYHINILPDYNSFTGMPKNDPETFKKTETEIIDILKMLPFPFERSAPTGQYSIYNQRANLIQNHSIVVTLKNENELKELVKHIHEVQHINASIGKVEFDEPGKAEQIMINNVLQKAITKATIIAKSIRRELGDVISYAETNKDIKSIIAEDLYNNRNG